MIERLQQLATVARSSWAWVCRQYDKLERNVGSFIQPGSWYVVYYDVPCTEDGLGRSIDMKYDTANEYASIFNGTVHHESEDWYTLRPKLAAEKNIQPTTDISVDPISI